MKLLRLVSWNVNGLRAVHRKEHFLPMFEKTKPDILCLQETKSEPGQLSAEVKNIPGYEPYFTACEIKKGYSGVAIYTNLKPDKVEHGIGVKEFDQEGRIISAHFKHYILFNVYFPNGGMGNKRVPYKLRFFDAFLQHIEKLRKQGKHILFTGDVNVAHQEIDLARPKENVKNTGFLPEERAWLDAVTAKGYIDTFRYFHPDQKDAYSYWDQKTFARARNVGWRIDYFFVSPEMKRNLVSADIFPAIQGSDHCPVVLELKGI